MIARTLVLVALLFAAPSIAAAQDPRAEAREHFDRGIALFNEGHFDGALAELQRAYDLAPAYPVLYNLARVHAELGHPVEAARAYERYLAEGSAEIRADRRREVEAAIAAQRDRIGTLSVRANVAGALISVDGVDVGQTPGAPIELSVGAHTIGVRAPMHESVTRAIQIASRTETVLELELRREIAERGILRITAQIPGVTITIDGVAVGTTPLDGSIPIAPGHHEIRADRVGYLPESEHVHVVDGGEYDVRFRMSADPAPHPSSVGTLALRLPDTSVTLRVDGEERSARERLTLPIGSHRIDVEAADRQPWTGEAVVAPADTLELAPPLTWTPEARHARTTAAESSRVAGIVTTFSGIALLGGGLALIGWNESEVAATDAWIRDTSQRYLDLGCPASGHDDCDDLLTTGQRLNSDQDVQQALRGVSIGTAVLGAAMMTLGVVLWVGAPDDAAIDASAHAELRIGPASASVSGAF